MEVVQYKSSVMLGKQTSSRILMTFAITDMTVQIISILLNTLGLYLVSKLKRPKNIHIILNHLSMSEIVIQVFRFVSAIYFFWYDDHEEYLGYQVTRTFTVLGLCVTYILIMSVVALDPLLIVILKTKYQTYITQRKVNKILALCWAVGVIHASTSFYFRYMDRENFAANYTFPSVTVLFVLFSATSYIVIYRAIKEKTKNLTHGSVTTRNSKPALKFRVPVLITLTFFLFCLTPSLVQSVIGIEGLSKIFMSGLGIWFSLGFIVDSLIYMFLHPIVKKLLVQFIQTRHIKCKQTNFSTTNVRSMHQNCHEQIEVKVF